MIWLALKCALLSLAACSLRMKGMTYTNDRYCPDVPFDSFLSDYSLKQLRSTGAEWIALVVTEYQDHVTSTTIAPYY
jgi:hypothetical protein